MCRPDALGPEPRRSAFNSRCALSLISLNGLIRFEAHTPGLHERDRAGQSADDTVFSVACLAHRRRFSPLARKPAFLATRFKER